MGYSRLLSLQHIMLFSMSTNTSDFQVTGHCLVTFVWCYFICEMWKCLNYDLRRTSTFLQCEEGSNILAQICVCQWAQALHDFPCICLITTRTFDFRRWGSNNEIRFEICINFREWYGNVIAAFYLTLQKDKDGSSKNPIHHWVPEVSEILNNL